MQGIQCHSGSMLIGPAGSGKVQLIKVGDIVDHNTCICRCTLNYFVKETACFFFFFVLVLTSPCDCICIRALVSCVDGSCSPSTAAL